jgi:hypothetical protein
MIKPQSSLAAKFQHGPLPAGMGTMKFEVKGYDIEICVSQVEKIEYFPTATETEPEVCAKLLYNGGTWIKSYGASGIKQIRDMYLRALCGEITDTREYDDNGDRLNNTPLIEDIARTQFINNGNKNNLSLK